MCDHSSESPIMRYWREESCHLQALVSVVMGTAAEIRRGDGSTKTCCLGLVTYMQLNVSIIYPLIFVQRIKMLSSCSSCAHVWPRPQCFKQKQGKFCLADCACSSPVYSLQWTVILSHLGFSRGELRPTIS